MVLNRQRRVRVSLAPLAVFLERVRAALYLPDDSVSVCLVSDAAIARMNRAYRGKYGPTDVLSFPDAPANGTRLGAYRSGMNRKRSPKARISPTSSTSIPSSTSFLGDIAISPETARRNARRFGRALADELRILILHGVLHLLGYDHETDRGEMDRLERRLRRRLGLG